MTPGVTPLHGIVNVQMVKTFYYRQGPQGGASSPVNLTGWEARFTAVRADYSASSAQALGLVVMDLRSSAGAIVLTPDEGKVQVNFSRAVMAIKPGEHRFNLVLTAPNGQDYPLLTGPLSIIDNGVLPDFRGLQ